MISSRGPDHVLVIDRVAVPVKEICSSLIECFDTTEVQVKYPVTDEEIFACADLFSDNFGPTENDFIIMECDTDPAREEINVETKEVSDWVFITAISIGRLQKPELNIFRALYAYGLESIIGDCLGDIVDGRTDYQNSDIHSIVYNGFTKSFGEVDAEKAKFLLSTLELGR